MGNPITPYGLVPTPRERLTLSLLVESKWSETNLASSRVPRSVRRTLRPLPEVRFQAENIPAGEGLAKNVSVHGLGVLSDSIPALGGSVHLVFQDDTLLWIELRGVVRWIREQTDESGDPGFGVEIETPPPEYRAFFDRLLAKDE